MDMLLVIVLGVLTLFGVISFSGALNFLGAFVLGAAILTLLPMMIFGIATLISHIVRK